MRWELSASRLRPEENEVRRRCDLPGTGERNNACLGSTWAHSSLVARLSYCVRLDNVTTAPSNAGSSVLHFLS